MKKILFALVLVLLTVCSFAQSNPTKKYYEHAKNYIEIFNIQKSKQDLFVVMYLEWQKRRIESVGTLKEVSDSIKLAAVDRVATDVFKTVLTSDQIKRLFSYENKPLPKVINLFKELKVKK